MGWWLQTNLVNSYAEKTELQRLKAELETRAQKELDDKLEEVNAYLAEQAKARERLDRIRDNNEMEIRKDFERMKKDLLVGLKLLFFKNKIYLLCKDLSNFLV